MFTGSVLLNPMIIVVGDVHILILIESDVQGT